MRINIRLPKKRLLGFIILFIICVFSLNFECPNNNHDNNNDNQDIKFRVMTYNALKFSNDDGDRAPYFQTIFNAVNPDIIIMQEIVNEGGADTLLNRLNKNNNNKEYARLQFIDGTDTDNIIFYNTSIFTQVSQKEIKTDLREISEYVTEIENNEIRFYSCHLKASPGSSNEDKRLEEVTKLRNYLNDSIPIGAEFIIVGDMNLYKSDEPAYQKFIGSEQNNNGRAKDIIGIAGDWHDGENYAIIHTQSPRKEFGGRQFGGLDDRFDFIFANYEINNNSRIEYIANSYKAYGNDGKHFNLAINDGINDSVSLDIANALLNATDHLPVIADFISLRTKDID